MEQKFNSQLKDLGEKGEITAIGLLKSFGFILSRPDYSGYRLYEDLFYREKINAHEDIDFEIKTKAEPFKPPPFYGHGIDKYQLKKRLRRFKKYNIKQFLLIIQKDGKIYGQWIDRLESLPDNKKFDTKNNIRIYSLEEFFEISI